MFFIFCFEMYFQKITEQQGGSDPDMGVHHIENVSSTGNHLLQTKVKKQKQYLRATNTQNICFKSRIN